MVPGIGNHEVVELLVTAVSTRPPFDSTMCVSSPRGLTADPVNANVTPASGPDCSGDTGTIPAARSRWISASRISEPAHDARGLQGAQPGERREGRLARGEHLLNRVVPSGVQSLAVCSAKFSIPRAATKTGKVSGRRDAS